jgi:uncharacterized protein YdeI (YjbR/CyaY-like superfamily)
VRRTGSGRAPSRASRSTSEPIYFRSAAELRRWLDENHAKETELPVGFFKLGAKEKSITYKEVVHEALCHGWIDGVRRSVDAERWTIRVTPRKPRSKWSRINIARMEELVKLGRATAAGLAAFEDVTRRRTSSTRTSARAPRCRPCS